MMSILESYENISLERSKAAIDHRTYELLLSKYWNLVFGSTYARVGNFEDALDITQDAFITAYVKLNTLRHPEKFKYWILSIAENQAKMHFRKKKRTAGDISLEAITSETDLYGNPGLEAGLLGTNNSGEDAICHDELCKELENAIISLPEEFRQVLVLAVLCRLSYRECSEILNVPVTTITNRLHKAKSIMRMELKGFMENSGDLFNEIRQNSIGDMERVAEHLNKVYEAINIGNFDEAEILLAKAPTLAGDNGIAHRDIASCCGYAAKLEWLKSHKKRESMFQLAEQELLLFIKLGADNIPIDSTSAPIYEPYNILSDLYISWGKLDKAIEASQKAIELGDIYNHVEGDILFENNEYEKAAAYFTKYISADNIDIYNKFHGLNRLSLCYDKLGLENEYVETVSKEIDHIKANEEEFARAGIDAANCMYYLACWYAKRDNLSKTLEWLKKTVDEEPQYAEWAKTQGCLAKYRDLPEFRAIVGEDEGHSYPIVPKIVTEARARIAQKR